MDTQEESLNPNNKSTVLIEVCVHTRAQSMRDLTVRRLTSPTSRRMRVEMQALEQIKQMR